VLFIDYPGFSIAMEKALRKKNFKGKLIHYICPTVWAWKKKRIFTLNRVLDLLLCILPFEPKCFANLPKNTSSVDTHYVGHPLIAQIPSAEKNTPQNIIGLFPGSRIHAIKRNLPIQIKAVEQFMEKDENLKCGISLSHPKFVPLIKEMTKQKKNFFFFSQEDNYQMMKKLKLAIATSGTITLELALHNVPTVVTYAIKPLDLFIARKIFKINLPYYCLVNIIANKEIFKEAYGPNLTPENLLHHIETFLNEKEREKCIEECKNIRKILGEKNAAKEATKLILKCIF
jgi:lipid-A-disaccharide synthase